MRAGRARRARGAVVLAIAAAVSTFVPLAGCGGGGGGEVVLHFWQFWDTGVVEPMVRRFEASHPGVRVEVEQLTWQSGLEKIQAAVASGTQPDVCELGSTWVPRFAYDGVLADLTPVYHAEADSFLMWESTRIGNQVVGLPWLQGSRVLFYNRALFRRAGLDPDHPPQTWAELLDAARRIEGLALDIHGFGLNLGERYVLYKKFMAFAWGNGGRILTPDGTVAFDGKETLEALQFYLQLAEYSLKEKQEVLDHEFKAGRLGMQISGAWNLKNYAQEAPDLDYGVALVPKPSADHGTHASFAGAEILVVFAKTAHRDLAVELARYLQAYPQAKAVSLAAGSVFPASRRALDDTTFTSDPKMRVFMQQALTSRTAPAHPGWVEMEDVINTAVESALYGRCKPKDCLAQASSELKGIVARYPRKDP